jgi:SMC interacting uncharacterized protein involved in chromosome segregation
VPDLVRKYWKEALIVVLVITVGVSVFVDDGSIQDALDLALERHSEELETLTRLHEEELAKKEAALENYENQIKQLEQDYQKQISQLEKEISKRQREVRDLRANKPEALAEVITEKFGFEYVP